MRYLQFIYIFSLILISQNLSSSEIVVLGLFNGMVIITVDGEKRKLRDGQVSLEGIKLIESNSEQAVLEINGKREVHKLGTHISTRFERDAQSQAQIWPKNGMYLTSGSINGQAIDFMVDTGATFVVMNSLTAKKLGIDYRYIGEKSWASTASGTVATYNLKLKTVQVGDIKLLNIQGAVIEGDSPTTVLLGNSFLNRLEMTRKGSMMLLKTKF
ncbi:MAG: TIGR02281 family clan AA aspartic protease [Thiohalomonadales bacterium]